MPQRVMRGAFIGFGNVAAQGHLPGWRLRDDITIVAATDVAVARKDAYLTSCPNGRWYDCIDELLASEPLDFVDICTPPGSHAALIEQALAAGLHVLCEKPMVTRATDTLAVAAAATRAGRIVHTVHNWLEAPICRKISALIKEGAVGTVRSIDWHTLRTQPAVAAAGDGGDNWRVDPAMAGGGILVDHGWHALYCVMRWAGRMPNAVAAVPEARRYQEPPIDETATLDLEMGAASAHIHLTWAASERVNLIAIEGHRGRIFIDDEFVVAEGQTGERRWYCPPSLSAGSYHPDWFAGVAEEFHVAATGGAVSNLTEATMCARIIEMAQRSSEAGGARWRLDA